MEFLIKNPGFQQIAETVFLYLNLEALLICTLVSKTFKAFLDNPKFWLKKCSEKNLSKDLRILWTNLIKKIENTSLEQNVNSCLVKMHRDAPYSYQVSFFLLEKKVGILFSIYEKYSHKGN